jgi:hypothetical protein
MRSSGQGSHNSSSSSHTSSSYGGAGASSASGVGSRNAQAALDFAHKKREQVARANELRKEREETKLMQQRTEDLGGIPMGGRGGGSRGGNGFEDYNGGGGVMVRRGSARSDIPNVPNNVEITSYGDYCERIVIRNRHQQQSSSAASYPRLESAQSAPSSQQQQQAGQQSSSSSSAGRVTSKRQQEVLARARANAAGNGSGGGMMEDYGFDTDQFASKLTISGVPASSASRSQQPQPRSHHTTSQAASAQGRKPAASATSGEYDVSDAAAYMDNSAPFFSQSCSLSAPRVNSNAFITPPIDPAGRLYDLSDRLVCGCYVDMFMRLSE